MRPENRFLMALAASSAIHAAGVISILEISRSTPVVSADEPSEVRLEIRVGIDRSVVTTLTWLGFEIPTPHEADLSRVEQAAFTMASATSGRTVERVVPPMPVKMGLLGETSQASSLAEIATAPPPQAESERGVPALEVPSVPVEIMREVEEVSVALPAGEAVRASPTMSSASRAYAAASGAGEGAEGPAANRAGVSTDRESPATSLKRPLRVRPGQPAAAEGLKIRTRIPPTFSIPTTILSQGRRAVYRVSFGGDGQVKKVEVARSSGDRNVDEPGRTALYSWTAEGEVLASLPTGEDLARLPADDPSRYVAVYIELLPAGI